MDLNDKYLIHGMLCLIQSNSKNEDKFDSFYEALTGMGIVPDHDIPETLTLKQAQSIALEYVSRVYDVST